MSTARILGRMAMLAASLLCGAAGVAAPASPTAAPASAGASTPATSPASSPTSSASPRQPSDTAAAPAVRRAPSGESGAALSPCAGEGGAPCCCGAAPPLRLEGMDFRLPDASQGKAYTRSLGVHGGRPPYRFTLAEGQLLPEGLQLTVEGQITGTAAAPGRQGFIAMVQDATGRRSQQRYVLVVRPAPQAAPDHPATPASSAAPTRPALAAVPAALPASRPSPGLAYVYRLDAPSLDPLQAEPEPAAAGAAPASAAAESGTQPGPAPAPAPSGNAAGAGIRLSKDEAAALAQMLEPMFGIEYPTLPLFLAALDMQLCQSTRQVVLAAAAQDGRRAPSDKELAAWCPPDWRAAAARENRAAGSSSVGKAGAKVSLKELPLSLMSAGLRERLIQLARQPHALLGLPPIQWQGRDCGCLRHDLAGKQIYGFFPGWWAGENLQPATGWLDKLPLLTPTPPGQWLDFSMLSRIGYFALPLEADLPWQRLGDLDSTRTDFIREARRHGTQLDLTLLANDWRFLQSLPQADAEAERQAMVGRLLNQLPRQARELIDRPLPGLVSRAMGWLPFFGEPQHLGDGITLFLDALPPDQPDSLALRQEFQRFYPKLIAALIDELRKGGRPYALNLVVNDRDFGGSEGAIDLATLFGLIKRAELPAAEPPYFKDDRIIETTGDYRSGTNLTLRMLVLLSEPTSERKKALHLRVESDPALHGINRRVFFRKIIPVLPAHVGDEQQFADDLAYFEDNFGGIGFWPLLMLPGDKAINDKLLSAFSAAADDGIGHSVCAFECEHRWWVRALFELALLVGLVTFSILAWRCELRQRWDRFVKSGAALVAALGLLLLGCDPAFEGWREHGMLMWMLALLLLASALWNWLKPKVEKP